jgi:hypothetical protein
MFALLALDAVNQSTELANIPGMVWDLIFWLVVRGVLAVITFMAIAGLGALIAAGTDRGGFALAGIIFGWIGAAAVGLWGLWMALLSLIALVNALGWFQ